MLKSHCSRCGSGGNCVSTGYSEKQWNELTERSKNSVKKKLSSGLTNQRIIEIVDELIKRKQLFDKGVITDAEFKTLKTEKIREIKNIICEGI